jgi:arylsulfatase A-like enzyme
MRFPIAAPRTSRLARIFSGLAALVVFLVAGPSALRAAAAEPPPNLIVIYTDDIGYGDLGCYGASKVRTPHIDRLAREGRRFTDAHTVSAVCTPSRYALLTGEYPFRINSFAPVFARAGLIVDPAKNTVARHLRSAGYATACIGKWHLGFGPKGQVPDWNTALKPGPRELGFDWFYGLPTVSSHSPFVLMENDRVLGLDPADPLVHGGTPPTQPFPEKNLTANPVSGGRAAHALYRDEELGTHFAAKAVAWLHEKKSAPFFLLFSTPHIHHPFTPHPRFHGTSEAGRYGDFIHELDWMVGELLRTLDELKLADRTLVLFTSDNGAMLNDGGQAAWRAGHRPNGDLLGFKFGAWEGGHRVPFIARWPGRIPAGTTSSALVANVDLLATVAVLVRRPLASADAPDSFNLLPALLGDSPRPIRDHLVIAPFSPKLLALRSGDWVYLSGQGDGGFGGVRGGPASLAFSQRPNSDVTPDGKLRPDAPPDQLYHLGRDPQQTKNVVRDEPAVAARLRAELAAHRAAARTAPPR